MHILITDSGVGGLSVCAFAEKFVRTHGFKEPVRLTFANAAPENDYGYNSMPSKEVKLQTFDRFLRNVTERFAPDCIYVACNTLSVLLPDTPYFQRAAIPVKGIIETAAKLLLSELEADPRSTAMIFGARGGGTNREVGVEFVTRYAIPEATVEALTWFLNDISPRTVAAMKNFVHLPDLF